jgi:plasmid stabilization system protein ParE
MRELIVRPDAESDITDAALWYEAQSQGLGSEFLRLADACLADVHRAPAQFPLIRRDARRALLRRFPYAIFFVVTDAAVDVVACLHVRRSPHEWGERLRRDR